MSTASAPVCETEPWGRYSASGGVYEVDGNKYFYSFGGDTTSDADGRGGVVVTNFRFNFDSGCWERLADSPTEIGYRATATKLLEGNDDSIYVLFGSNAGRAATDQLYQYSLANDTWTLLNPLFDNTTTAIPQPRWKHAAVPLDDRHILVTGGRDGATVHADAWILDTVEKSWTMLDTTGLPPMYRHGLAFDSTRNVTWIYGGLDETINRYRGQLWQLNMTSNEVTKVVVDTTANPLPPRLASHAMEYVQELDVLLLWGGTCSDDSELHIYDIEANSWCRIYPANRPDRRDAMLWSLQYPNFYMSQGDIICYNRQVLTIADVHVLNLQSSEQGWEMLYEPTNVPRGTGEEPYCDGSNAGNCQPMPLLSATDSPSSTCSADLLTRFFSGTTTTEMTEEEEEEEDTTTMEDPTMAPPATYYDGDPMNLICADVGFDFGWKVDGCANRTSTSFARLGPNALTTYPPEGCSPFIPGSFTLSCSMATDDGDDEGFQLATISTTKDTSVLIVGAEGGSLYNEISKSTPSYTLGVGGGDIATKIEKIEFCFQCPTPAPTTAPTPAPSSVNTTEEIVSTSKTFPSDEPDKLQAAMPSPLAESSQAYYSNSPSLLVVAWMTAMVLKRLCWP